jgi:ribose transport system permease protein
MKIASDSLHLPSGTPWNFRRPSDTEIILLVGILGLTACLALFGSGFISSANLANVLRSASILAIVSIGQMFVVILRGFDLSIAAVMALVSIVSASIMAAMGDDYSTVLTVTCGVLGGLMTGVIVGLVNGLCVTYLRVHAFMVTLGMASIIEGISMLLTDGIPVYGIPKVFSVQFGRALWLSLPAAFYIGIALVIVVAIMQRSTAAGRQVYAVGGAPKVATAAGISVNRIQVMGYVVSGLTGAIASLLLTSQIGSGQGSIGGPLTFQSIAVVVIAGVSLQGGVGRVYLVALAALFLALTNNAMELMRVQSQVQAVILGFIVILAAANDIRHSRKK